MYWNVKYSQLDTTFRVSYLSVQSQQDMNTRWSYSRNVLVDKHYSEPYWCRQLSASNRLYTVPKYLELEHSSYMQLTTQRQCTFQAMHALIMHLSK